MNNNTNKVDRIIQYAKFMVGSAETDLSDFKKKLEQDPANAFEWSDRATVAAARKHVYGSVLRALDKENRTTTPEALLRWAKDELRSHARFPVNSTSNGSRWMWQKKLVEFQELVDFLEGVE